MTRGTKERFKRWEELPAKNTVALKKSLRILSAQKGGWDMLTMGQLEAQAFIHRTTLMEACRLLTEVADESEQ